MENKKFSEEELNQLVDIARPGYILTEKEAKVGLKNITSAKELREILAPPLSDMEKLVILRKECGILEDHDFLTMDMKK